LNEQPPKNGCRPSADVLFSFRRDVFRQCRRRNHSDRHGPRRHGGPGRNQARGGVVIAQDEASSVVWGMPGSAFEAGVTDELLPLDQIARSVAGTGTTKREGLR